MQGKVAKIIRCSLVHAGFRFAFRHRMHRNPDDRRANYLPVEQIAVLKDVQDIAVRVIHRIHALDGLMQMRIKHFSVRVHALHAVPADQQSRRSSR